MSRTIAAGRWSPWWPGPVLGPAAMLTEVLLLGWFGDRAEVGHWVTHLFVLAVLAVAAGITYARARPRPVSGPGTRQVPGRLHPGGI